MDEFKPWPERIVRQNPCMNTVLCAVLVPIVRIDGEEHVVFEVRSSKLSWQPGDICFPGGVIEQRDASPLEAALRETQEEFGVGLPHIRVWGPLDYVESPVGVKIYPFAAQLDTTNFVVSRGEIDHLFTVPLAWFSGRKPEVAQVELATRPGPGFPAGLPVSGQAGWKKRSTYNVLFYYYKEYKIWGITAQILDNFLGIRAIINA